jgi:hypothetical protein
MTGDGSFGKWLMIAGLGLFVLGAVAYLLQKFGISLGRLPGDISIEGDKGSFHFPIVTSIVLSIIATILLNLFRR